MSEETPDGDGPATAPPASIDTDVHSFAREIEGAAPDEPFMIDVALRGVTLRRIDLEREEGETFGDWIATAVDERVLLAGHDELSTGNEPHRSGPPDDTPAITTPDAEIIDEISDIDFDEWVKITVELPADVLIALFQLAGERLSVCECIRSAISTRLATIEREHVYTPTMRVDVPPGVAQRARLHAEFVMIRAKNGDYQATFLGALRQLVEPQIEYAVNGEIIASFAETTHEQGKIQ